MLYYVSLLINFNVLKSVHSCHSLGGIVPYLLILYMIKIIDNVETV